MHKIFIYLLLLFIPVKFSQMRSSEPVMREVSSCRQLYQEMQLEGIVNFTAFEQAIAGYNKIEEKSKEILTLVDFSKPSTEERFYVFDMRHKKLLFSSLVSHGKNSGGNYATSFSNENGSLKSSLGFFLTENTYQGKNGYSLVLNGLEKGDQRPCQRLGNRNPRSSLLQPFCHSFIRSSGTQFRLSGTATSCKQAYYQHDQRRFFALYLCQ